MPSAFRNEGGIKASSLFSMMWFVEGDLALTCSFNDGLGVADPSSVFVGEMADGVHCDSFLRF